jgi:hypothetical protein
MPAALSFEQAPPLASTFRFFLTAPWFGVAAGALLAWIGAPALASRWSGTAAALTHLLAAGFMLQAMSGALLQIVPVVAGGNVWRPRLVAVLVHAAITLGASLLVAALLLGQATWLPSAQLALGAGIALFVGVVGLALLRTASTGASMAGLRIAVGALAITATLGIVLARILAGHPGPAFVPTADIHAALGLGAWALLLLAAVSFTVLPMFQLTPPYPRWMHRGLPAALFALLAARAALSWCVAQWAPWAERAAAASALLLAAAFAVVTLRLQRRSRRARVDATRLFFRSAMLSLLLADTVLLAGQIAPAVTDFPGLDVAIGIVVMVGVFVSAICGMLYKIVPFVCWLKLPSQHGAAGPRPALGPVITEGAMRAQLRLHLAALALLVASVPFGGVTRAAGAMFALSCGLLGVNLARGVAHYRRIKGRIASVA